MSEKGEEWSISPSSLFQSSVGRGFSPRPLIPPVMRTRSLLFGLIQVIQLKLLRESLNRYPGPKLKTIEFGLARSDT